MANTVRVYERLLGELAGLDRPGLCDAGDRVGGVIASRWPELVRELEGIAAGAGQPAALIAAINARTELMPSTAAAAECSLIAEARPGGGRLAQNWDWHPDLRDSIVIWSVVQPGGRWFATLTEAGILAKLGMTSTGLCCGLNFLRSSLDRGAGGVPVHVALRLVLDRCDRRADALTLLRSLELSSSSCITVAAEDGIAAIELSPAGRGVVEPDDRGHLVHANHFVGALPAGWDLEIADGPGSQLRHAHLEAALARDGFDHALLGAHNDGPEPVCRHDDPGVPWPDRLATLATVSLDPGHGYFGVALGPPCSTPLEVLELP